MRPRSMPISSRRAAHFSSSTRSATPNETWSRPTRYTVWCMSGSVSSSIAGSASKSVSYHGALTDRSRTVSATWVSGGNSVMSDSFLVGSLLALAVSRGTARATMTEAPPDLAATPLLHDALEQVRLDGAIFFRTELTEPFAFDSTPSALADQLHPGAER